MRTLYPSRLLGQHVSFMSYSVSSVSDKKAVTPTPAIHPALLNDASKRWLGPRRARSFLSWHYVLVGKQGIWRDACIGPLPFEQQTVVAYLQQC